MECHVIGCGRPAYYSRPWCYRHYLDEKENRPFRNLRARIGHKAPCSHDPCDRPSRVRGLCNAHDLQRQAGKPLGPIRERTGGAWPAGESGYMVIWDPERKRTVYEHRLVMEKTIGRHLFDDEEVHHKNGVRGDNRPGNLEIWVGSQPAGMRPEDAVSWATDILRRFTPDRLR